MRPEEATERPTALWVTGTGPHSDIVISSRIRLARNLLGVPFPHLLDEARAEEVAGRVEGAYKALQAEGKLADHGLVRVNRLPALDRQVLVEKHLISPQFAQEEKPTALLVDPGQTVSVMVNEEDHLRIQCLLPGLQLEQAWAKASQVDDDLEGKLDFAFVEQQGYLTACPTNVGTGLRASVMLHLPALILSNQAARVGHAVVKLGLAVRGLYGEGTEALGNMFQVSNQVTLGQTEEEIIQNLRSVTEQIVEHEMNARKFLTQENKSQIEDRVNRAYGLLAHARIMSSQEAMQLLSDLRLGVDLEILRAARKRSLNELLVVTRPAYLQRLAGGELEPLQRDIRRAAMIRDSLRAMEVAPPGDKDHDPRLP
ncbi:MAG TPA: protein arginine kinase [Bacillota bacterium]|jgi:protein arginine kinase